MCHADYSPTTDRVETEHEFRALLQGAPDIILADFSMPEFNSLRALEIMQECQLDIPFIIVSGTIGEERAVQAMQEGACDFIMKDRLARLGSAVKQALARQALKNEKRAAELTVCRLAAIVETSRDAIIAKTLDGIITSWNLAAEHLYGYSAKEILGTHLSVLIPDDRRSSDPLHCFKAIVQRLTNGEPIPAYETARVCKDGRRIELLLSISPIRDGNGVLTGASAIAHDITQRKRTERFLKAEQTVASALTDSNSNDAEQFQNG